MVLFIQLTSIFLTTGFLSIIGTNGSNEIGDIARNSSPYHVPVFTVQDLRTGSRKNELEHILGTTGLLSLKGSDQDMVAFQKVRHAAFSGLCTCMKRGSDKFASVQGYDSALLSDETTRVTLATATIGETPIPLDGEQLEAAGCTAETVESLDALRDYVALASKWFVTAMDDILKKSGEHILQSSTGKTFQTVSSIVKASNNLEHFHVYTKPSGSSETFDLDFHTDAGVFLTFVPGKECDQEGTLRESNNLYVQIEGVTHQAVFQDDSIAVMLGAGAEHWLKSSVALKATQHAVALPSGRSRAWYGMMHLVPQDAIVQDFPQRTFADMRKAMVFHGSKHPTYSSIEGEDVVIDDDVSIGCGVSSAPTSLWSANGGETSINRRRLQMVDDASACNNITNFYCWMSCLAIPDASTASAKMKDGYSLYCLDESELASTNNVTAAYQQCNTFGLHNDGCAGTWLPTVADVPSQEVIVDEEKIAASPMKFCYGGTSMYMDGFHWTNPTCVIYLFPNWILSSAGLLTVASVGTLFFGILLEAVIAKRRSVVQSFPLGWKRLTISTLFYGLQLTLGYMIMLVVMTYSGPLFMCVIFGLMGGHAIFNAGSGKARKEAALDQEPSVDETEPEQKRSGLDCCGNEIPEGFTPCCQNAL